MLVSPGLDIVAVELFKVAQIEPAALNHGMRPGRRAPVPYHELTGGLERLRRRRRQHGLPLADAFGNVNQSSFQLIGTHFREEPKLYGFVSLFVSLPMRYYVRCE